MAVENVELDDIDRALVGLLRRTGRMSYRDLGMEVALGASATADRVKRLERAGVIAGYSAVIDPETIGRTLRAAIDVRLMAVAGVPRLDDIVRNWGHSFLAETSTRILLHTVELENQPG